MSNDKEKSLERLIDSYYRAKDKSEKDRILLIIRRVKPDWRPVK